MSTELQTLSTNELVLSTNSMAQLTRLADLMASSNVTVPKHLQGKPGDCFAIALQATLWQMNAYAVAQKTHVVNGILGYEAQLVNAVVQSSGSINGRFHYEYQGDGTSLKCRVGAVIAGETEITWGEWLSIGEVHVKNSQLWKTNPKQQFAYLQVKNWARLYCPGAILGVYSYDELETITPQEKEINPAPSLDDALASIAKMELSDFKSFDHTPYNDEEKKVLRSAMTDRKNALKAATIETVTDLPTAIKSCQDKISLNDLVKQMTDQDKFAYDDIISDMYDSFKVVD